jgi:diguanylate cyclase (GGDEF)-like protein
MNNLSLTTSNNRPVRTTSTKPWNRDHAVERLAAELDRARTELGYQCSILLVQFDGMGRVTNRLGYASADNVVQRVQSLLMRDLGADDVCCRLGGDEFLLILPAKGEKECRDWVDQLHHRWSAANDSATIDLGVGYASSPIHGFTSEALFAAADENMYADKQRGQSFPGVPVSSVSTVDVGHLQAA